VSQTDLDTNARRLIALREKAGKSDLPTPPADLAGAYALQFAAERILVAEKGFAPIGWKIGATNAGARANFKLDDQFLGRLYRQMTVASPAKPPATPGLYRAYEAEFVIELGADLDATKGPVAAAAVRAATKRVGCAIEMVGGFIPMAAPHGAHSLIADFAGCANWIQGPMTGDLAGVDLDAAGVTFSLDGETKATGKGANVDGGPFGATAWLANALGKLGRSLKAGDLITTGTAIPPVPYAGDGKRAVADFGPLGKVEVTIG
jgi:2-keto-4-pentenoate hydratase